MYCIVSGVLERETYLGICQKLCDGSPKPQQTKKLSTHQLEVTLVSKTTDLGHNHLYVSMLQNYLCKCEGTYFVRWNMFSIHIHEDSFGAKILRDDCALTL